MTIHFSRLLNGTFFFIAQLKSNSDIRKKNEAEICKERPHFRNKIQVMASDNSNLQVLCVLYTLRIQKTVQMWIVMHACHPKHQRVRGQWVSHQPGMHRKIFLNKIQATEVVCPSFLFLSFFRLFFLSFLLFLVLGMESRASSIC